MTFKSIAYYIEMIILNADEKFGTDILSKEDAIEISATIFDYPEFHNPTFKDIVDNIHCNIDNHISFLEIAVKRAYKKIKNNLDCDLIKVSAETMEEHATIDEDHKNATIANRVVRIQKALMMIEKGVFGMNLDKMV